MGWQFFGRTLSMRAFRGFGLAFRDQPVAVLTSILKLYMKTGFILLLLVSVYKVPS